VDEPIAHILKAGLVAWLTAGGDEDVVSTVEALHRGGVSVAAFQGPASALSQAVGRARTAFAGRVLMGAAGIRGAEEARAAVRAGAEFVFAIGGDPEVVDVCRDARALIIPGAFTPIEIREAWSVGTGLVALFPAGGTGPEYVRDILRAMPDVRIAVAGGIAPENAGEFIRAGAAAVVAVMESTRDYDAVLRRARGFVDAIDRARARLARPAPPLRPIEGPDIR
jgi:2-dehydro-3-deoxyphosphogluconate aldolase/(4S)-4-hydroxy-2-oxoglutarate aldolase